MRPLDLASLLHPTSSFQRIVVETLEGLQGVAVYIDDIIIHGIGRKEHEERLQKIKEQLDSIPACPSCPSLQGTCSPSGQADSMSRDAVKKDKVWLDCSGILVLKRKKEKRCCYAFELG